MKSLRFTIPIFLLISTSSVVFAETQQTLYFRGILTDSAGFPIEDNVHSVKFKIYASQISETIFWESNGFVPIRTTNGYCSHRLGSTNILPDSLFQLDFLWLGITVGLTKEIYPRFPLVNYKHRKKKSADEEVAFIETPEIRDENFDVTVESWPPHIDSYGHPNYYNPKSNRITAGLAFKFGADALGKYKVTGFGTDQSNDVDLGWSFGVILFIMNPSGTVRYGIGGDMQISRQLENNGGNFNFYVLYLDLKIHPSIYRGNIQPYIDGRFGFDYLKGDNEFKGTGIEQADLEGGLYYGFGIGLLSDSHFQIEMAYAVNNGKTEIFGENYDIKYSKASLTIGYNFCFSNY